MPLVRPSRRGEVLRPSFHSRPTVRQSALPHSFSCYCFEEDENVFVRIVGRTNSERMQIVFIKKMKPGHLKCPAVPYQETRRMCGYLGDGASWDRANRQHLWSHDSYRVHLLGRPSLLRPFVTPRTNRLCFAQTLLLLRASTGTRLRLPLLIGFVKPMKCRTFRFQKVSAKKSQTEAGS